MVANDSTLRIEVDDAGAIYPINVDPWVHVGRASRTIGSADDDYLGISVAISADGTTIAAGAPRDDTTGTDRGRVDVFVRPATGWGSSTGPTAKLTRATGSTDGDAPGYSVSISADGSTIASGVPYDTTGGSSRGRVDVCVRPCRRAGGSNHAHRKVDPQRRHRRH